MSRAEFDDAVRSFSPEQFEAVRVCIMAERRLRHLYPRSLPDAPALDEAYGWAMQAEPEPSPPALTGPAVG